MYCYVPGCANANTSSKEEKKSRPIVQIFFSAPGDENLFKQWQDAVPIGEHSFSRDDKICEYHFQKSEVILFTETKLPNGHVRRVPAREPKLKPGTVPSIFPIVKAPAVASSIKNTPNQKVKLKRKASALEDPEDSYETPSKIERRGRPRRNNQGGADKKPRGKNNKSGKIEDLKGKEDPEIYVEKEKEFIDDADSNHELSSSKKPGSIRLVPIDALLDTTSTDSQPKPPPPPKRKAVATKSTGGAIKKLKGPPAASKQRPAPASVKRKKIQEEEDPLDKEMTKIMKGPSLQEFGMAGCTPEKNQDVRAVKQLVDFQKDSGKNITTGRNMVEICSQLEIVATSFHSEEEIILDSDDDIEDASHSFEVETVRVPSTEDIPEAICLDDDTESIKSHIDVPEVEVDDKDDLRELVRSIENSAGVAPQLVETQSNKTAISNENRIRDDIQKLKDALTSDDEHEAEKENSNNIVELDKVTSENDAEASKDDSTNDASNKKEKSNNEDEAHEKEKLNDYVLQEKETSKKGTVPEKEKLKNVLPEKEKEKNDAVLEKEMSVDDAEDSKDVSTNNALKEKEQLKKDDDAPEKDKSKNDDLHEETSKKDTLPEKDKPKNDVAHEKDNPKNDVHEKETSNKDTVLEKEKSGSDVLREKEISQNDAEQEKDSTKQSTVHEEDKSIDDTVHGKEKSIHNSELEKEKSNHIACSKKEGHKDDKSEDTELITIHSEPEQESSKNHDNDMPKDVDKLEEVKHNDDTEQHKEKSKDVAQNEKPADHLEPEVGTSKEQTAPEMDLTKDHAGPNDEAEPQIDKPKDIAVIEEGNDMQPSADKNEEDIRDNEVESNEGQDSMEKAGSVKDKLQKNDKENVSLDDRNEETEAASGEGDVLSKEASKESSVIEGELPHEMSDDEGSSGINNDQNLEASGGDSCSDLEADVETSPYLTQPKIADVISLSDSITKEDNSKTDDGKQDTIIVGVIGTPPRSVDNEEDSEADPTWMPDADAVELTDADDTDPGSIDDSDDEEESKARRDSGNHDSKQDPLAGPTSKPPEPSNLMKATPVNTKVNPSVNIFTPETIQQILKQIKLPLTTPVTLKIAPLVKNADGELTLGDNQMLTSAPGTTPYRKIAPKTPQDLSAITNADGQVTPISKAGLNRAAFRTYKTQISLEKKQRCEGLLGLKMFEGLGRIKKSFDYSTFMSKVDDEIQFKRFCLLVKECLRVVRETKNAKTNIGKLTLNVTRLKGPSPEAKPPSAPPTLRKTGNSENIEDPEVFECMTVDSSVENHYEIPPQEAN